MKKTLFSKMLSVSLGLSLAVSSVATGSIPVNVRAEETQSVFDFDYGGGIVWNVEDELPTFAPITATSDDPIDAFVANDSIGKSENTDQDPFAVPVKYAMVTLQGIVNRTSPRILIQESREEGQDIWPNELVGEENYRKTSDYIYMINKYRSYIKGMVVYTDLAATRNVATSIAGAMDYIAVDRDLAREIQDKCGLEVKLDLNEISSIYDERSAYNYLYDNYYATGLLNKRLLMGLNPDAHFPYNRDLAVATKSAVLWLEPDNDEDREVLDKFYNLATPGVTFNLGWWPNEDSGICYATKKGCASVPSDWFENMTVYMAGKKEFDIPAVPAKPELQNKIYVAFAISDGDNAAYNEHAMRVRWGAPERQKYPISWTISPALYYCAPQMLNYYQKTAGKDMLICGPSGLGYTKTTRWRTSSQFFEKNIASTDKLFEKTGLNIITMWDRISEECYDEYTGKIHSLLGATINNNGFNDRDADNPDSMFNGNDYMYYPGWGQLTYKNDTPLMGLGFPWGYCSDEDCEDRMYDSLANIAENYDGSKPEFQFAQFVTWVTTVKDMNDVADRLNERYPGKFEFVRADHFFMLANEYNNVPYNVSLQCKASASGNDSNSSASNAVDGTISTGWSDTDSEDKWYQVDLGTQCSVSRYVLKNATTGYYDASQNVKNYAVEYSTDGVNWNTAETVYNNEKDIVYTGFERKITARYVRIHILDAGSGQTVRIQDLEVYGNPVYATENEFRTVVNTAQMHRNNHDFCENEHWQEFTSALDRANGLLESNRNYEDEKEQFQESYDELVRTMELVSTHTEAINLSVAATCEETGLTEGKYCSACQKILVAQQSIEATGHTPVTQGEVAATCKNTGYTGDIYCEVCNQLLEKGEIIPETDHIWVQSLTPTIANPDGEQYITYRCNVCGETKMEKVPSANSSEENSSEEQSNQSGSGSNDTTTPGYNEPGNGQNETTTPGYNEPDNGQNETTTPGYNEPGSRQNETTTPGYNEPGNGQNETTTPGYNEPGSGQNETTTPGYNEPDNGQSETTTPGYDEPGSGTNTPVPVIPGYDEPGSGTDAPVPVIPGYDEPDSGTNAPVPVIPGYDEPDSGTNAPVPVIPGYDEPGSGTNDAIPAIPGYDEPGSGTNDAVPAIPGYDESGSGTNDAVPVIPGYDEPDSGTNDAVPVIPGYDQPGGGTNNTVPVIPGYDEPGSGMNTSDNGLPISSEQGVQPVNQGSDPEIIAQVDNETTTQKKGSKFKAGGYTYKVLNSSKKTVSVIKPTKASLQKATIPAKVTYKHVTYSVTEIADGAFQNKKKLKQVTIGKNIKVIGKNAFKNCTKLKKVTIQSKKLNKVGKKAFAGTTSPVTLKLPSSLSKSKANHYKKLLKKAGLK